MAERKYGGGGGGHRARLRTSDEMRLSNDAGRRDFMMIVNGNPQVRFRLDSREVRPRVGHIDQARDATVAEEVDQV